MSSFSKRKSQIICVWEKKKISSLANLPKRFSHVLREFSPSGVTCVIKLDQKTTKEQKDKKSGFVDF